MGNGGWRRRPRRLLGRPVVRVGAEFQSRVDVNQAADARLRFLAAMLPNRSGERFMSDATDRDGAVQRAAAKLRSRDFTRRIGPAVHAKPGAGNKHLCAAKRLVGLGDDGTFEADSMITAGQSQEDDSSDEPMDVRHGFALRSVASALGQANVASFSCKRITHSAAGQREAVHALVSCKLELACGVPRVRSRAVASAPMMLRNASPFSGPWCVALL
jgi:hypothetical protein